MSKSIGESQTFLDDDHTDMLEATQGAPVLFARTLKKLSELSPGEVYGFFPALAMGGSARLDTLRKVKALEHLAFLAQLGPARLMDYRSGRESFVRELGPQAM